ncbi:cytochrome P450 [Streptomyces yaizuensis]|uniref:Cytochrome P450 n=1 Tax=Streptomyces yaizuensis TaxID=2989713 RepID=A0ABQ5NYE4_9ACTN|nr:cytochrome P450 [Streptomyces sp. YSPA8]GLF95383.1 cytochrome P450 [Streptomyces sp. YSPA8]
MTASCDRTAGPIPRAPGGLPLLGHAMSLIRDPLGFLDRQRGLGDIVEFRLGSRTACILNHPELVRAMLTGPSRHFDRGEIFTRARPLFGNGVAVADGRHHRDRRRAVQPLLNSARLTTYLDTMAKLAAATAASWSEGRHIDLNAEMTDLTLSVVAATIFGQRLPAEFSAVIHRNLPIVVAGLARRAYGPAAVLLDRIPHPERKNYRTALNSIHRMVDALISANRDSPTLAELSAGADERQLHDDVTSLLIGGSHTSAAAAAWQFILISRNPQIRRRLREETDRVLGSRAADPADLPELVYTRRIVQETLRLYPPIWLFPRRAADDVRVGRHSVERGTQIFYSPYAMHRDARWYPRPTSFDPDRWDPDRHLQPPQGAYLPFAAGVHGCPGGDFALAELTLLTATITATWQLDPLPGSSHPRPVAGATLGPEPVTMVVTARPRPTGRDGSRSPS